jgi:hypothetical protein
MEQHRSICEENGRYVGKYLIKSTNRVAVPICVEAELAKNRISELKE